MRSVGYAGSAASVFVSPVMLSITSAWEGVQPGPALGLLFAGSHPTRGSGRCLYYSRQRLRHRPGGYPESQLATDASPMFAAIAFDGLPGGDVGLVAGDQSRIDAHHTGDVQSGPQH